MSCSGPRQHRLPACLLSILLVLAAIAAGGALGSDDSRAEGRAGHVATPRQRHKPSSHAGPAAATVRIERPAGAGGGTQLTEAADRRHDRDVARHRARQEPAAREARRRSRTRYRGLTRTAAVSLTRRRLADQLARPSRPLAQDAGKVEAYSGANVARVRQPDGTRQLVQSLLPLRTEDASGDLAPVDLTLERTPDGFRPRNAPVGVGLPARLDDHAVTLEDPAIAITLPAAATTASGTAADGGVIYANSGVDTDTVVVPQMSGVEIYDVLRSAASPERLVERFGGGVTLRSGLDGSVEVVRDGKIVAGITPATAWDADGEPVPVTMAPHGDQLVITARHRDKDYAYPITVDPFVVAGDGTYLGDDFQWNTGVNTTPISDYRGWYRISNRASPNTPGLGCTDTGGAFCFNAWDWIYGPGLYTWMRDQATPGFNNQYNVGDTGEWVYTAPGTAFINRATYWNLRNEYGSSCVYGGIFHGPSYRWERQSWTDGGARTVVAAHPPSAGAPIEYCGAQNKAWVEFCPGDGTCTNQGDVNSAGPSDWELTGNTAIFGTKIPYTSVASFTGFLGAANIGIGDRDRPTFAGTSVPATWLGPNGTFTVTSADTGVGIEILQLKADGTTFDNAATWTGSPTVNPSCFGGSGTLDSRPCPATLSANATVGDLTTGYHTIRARTKDAVLNTTAADGAWTLKVDRTAPAFDPSGTFIDNQGAGYTPGQSYTVTANATDGTSTAHQSGVQKIEFLIDGVVKSTKVTTTTGADDDPLSWSWAFTPSTYPASSELTVRVTDKVGNVRTSRSYPVQPAPATSRIGLERFWDYDTVDTGAGSQLLVNAENGNLLWHDVPVVDPGRGLSTFVSVTYNSLDAPHGLGRTDTIDPLGPLALTGGPSYDTAGRGVSLSVSGPTRLNEPLQGVGLADERDGTAFGDGTARPLTGDLGNAITLIDADGTRHGFRRDPDDARRWLQPAGARLTLRRTTGAGTELVARRWVMTRPDGVAYFFNKLGYLVATVDRNGNTLNYTYEYYDVLTGQSGASASGCTLASVPGAVAGEPNAGNQWGMAAPLAQTVTSSVAGRLCVPRVTKVTDPGLRDLTVVYQSRVAADQTRLDSKVSAALNGSSTPLGTVLGSVAGTTSDLGTLLAPPPVDKLTDHAARDLKFGYTAAHLSQMTEVVNAGTLAPTGDRARRWLFQYDPPADTGLPQRLKAVVQDRDADEGGDIQSSVAYAARAGATELVPLTITDRRGKLTTYAFSNATANPRTLTITDARGKSWIHRVDGFGRPFEVADPLGDITTLQWDGNAPSQRLNELTRTAAGVIRNVGGTITNPGSVTKMEYEHTTGQLTSQTSFPDGEAQPATARRTELDYYLSAGAASLRPASDPADGFVADLKEIRRPRVLPSGKHVGFAFDVTTDTGNVNSRQDLEGATPATTAYCNGTDCPKGLVKRETDEVGNVTTYGDFDASGLPQTVVDPKGNPIAAGFTPPPGHDGTAANHRWLYRYDAVGNLRSVSDPRNADAVANPTVAAPATRYTTTFAYDAFDRTISQVTPKQSTSDRYVTENWSYDRDGNLLTATNPSTGRTTAATFSATDQPLTVTQTAWARSGSDPKGNTYTTRPEVTTFSYDDTDLLVSRTDPLGASGVPAGGGSPNLPYTTEWTRDDAGRMVAESRHATSKVHVRSFALDGRGNVVGEIDPARNSDPDGNGSDSDARTPAAAASAAATAIAANQLAGLRISRAYNAADDLTQQTERPAPTDPTSPAARTDKYIYDLDGNVVKQVLPRDGADVPTGFTAGAGNVAVTSTYDRRDQLVTSVDAYGATTTVKRRADGKVVAETSQRGTANGTTNADGSFKYFTTAYTYDAAGDLLTRSVPYAPNQYGRNGSATGDYASWKVAYARDAVGNPTTITDPRGHTITNTFLDGGQLAGTTRPSWWSLSWGDAGGAPDPGRRFQDPADTDLVPAGGPQLTERVQPLSGEDTGSPQQSTTTDGKFGAVTPAGDPDWLPRAGTTAFAYDDDGHLTSITDGATTTSPSISRIDYDPLGRIVGTTQPIGANVGATLTGGGDPTPCATSGCQRVGARRYDYDLDGNLTKSALLGDGTWHADFTYDSFDRLVDRTDPGASDVPSTWSTVNDTRRDTAYEYDANDNLTKRTTPRGTATATVGDFQYVYQYDTLDRLIAEIDPENDRWGYAYDVDDNLLRELSPNGSPLPAASQDTYKTLREYDADDRLVTLKGPIVDAATSTRNTTTYSYFPDGSLQSSLAPGALASLSGSDVPRLSAYDYDGRGLRSRVTTGHAASGGFSTAGNGPRTTLSEYDGNGDLRRTVDPSGVTTSGSGASQSFAPTNVDNLTASLDSTTSTNAVHATVLDYAGVSGDAGVPSRIYQPRSGTGDKVLAERLDHDELARLQTVWTIVDVSTPTPFKAHTSYTRLRNGWISGSKNYTDASVQLDESTYDYDQNGNQLRWTLDPRPSVAAADKTTTRIDRDYWPNGRMMRRIGIRNPGGSQTSSTYSYWYDDNDALTGVHDVDHTNLLAMAHDGAERTTSVVQRWKTEAAAGDPNGGSGSAAWQKSRDSAFTYDRDGNVITRRANGTLDRSTNNMSDPSVGYRTSARFTYDPEDKETIGALYEPTRVAGNPTIDDTTCAESGTPPAGVRCVRTTYHPSGQRRTRRQQDQTLVTTLFDDWAQPTERRRRPGGTGGSAADIVTSYTYDVRGNRTGDLPGQGTYQFNARDQLTQWKRGSDYTGAGKSNWTVDYDRNPDGSTQQSTDRKADTTVALTRTYDYTGQRLDDIKVVSNGTTTWEAYRANEFGSTIQIQTGITGSTAPPVTTPSKLTNVGCASALATTTSTTTNFCFDEFDRLRRQRAPGASEEQTFVYDGLDRRDERRDHVGGTAVSSGYSYLGASSTISRQEVPTTAGANTVSYDYDSDNAPLAATQQAGAGGTPATRTFATDANGNPTGLEDGSGVVGTADRYVYDPYGELDPTANAQVAGSESATNPLRFNGFDYDSAIKTYDMQARDYRPSIGRFMQTDRYESAQSDLSLVADPLTQNRYDFTGNDPVDSVEFDGHHLNSGDEAGSPGVPMPTTDSKGNSTQQPVPQRAKDINKTREKFRNTINTQANRTDQSRHRKARKIAGQACSAGGSYCTPAQNEYNKRQAYTALISGRDPYRLAYTNTSESDGADDAGVKAFVTGFVDSGKEFVSGVTHPIRTGQGLVWAAGHPLQAGSNVVATCFAHGPEGCAGYVTGSFLMGKGAGATGKLARRAAAGTDGLGTASVLEGAAAACSFAAETLVLMADGTHKPIGAIRVGDLVAATDPLTHERSARRVTHVWVHQDRILRLTAGDETLATTANHPFWDVTRNDWVAADRLAVGDRLLAAGGEAVRSEGGVAAGSARRAAYNLTVATVHTYHVGRAGILVHNSCGLPRFDGPKPTYRADAQHRAGRGLRKNKTPLPKDAEQAYANAVPNAAIDPTAWFARGEQGIYRYSDDNAGGAHFSGIAGQGSGTRNMSPYAQRRLGER